ncbi:hypothetical protein [Psychrobacter sp. AOP7-B1-24]|uniref:hypothetical protein n=1 Tax=Psychrobacter sp. AOP7-B1-24 TaxID=3457645 RepID=UPI00402B2EE5
MQMKHLIIFALIGIVGLFGFNLINGKQHEKNREVVVSSVTVGTSDTNIDSSATGKTASNSGDITSQPLAEQPKAILDSATSQINQAQQTEQKNLENMDSVAQ